MAQLRAIKKRFFFEELVAHKPGHGGKWLVNGDFNQIYRARDKNKRNVNRNRINRFRATLHGCDLREIHLQNRRFTWSNERQNPTMSKLDSVFCNAEWDIEFQNHILHALSSSLSDHCPMLLAPIIGPKKPRSFKFENFWIKMPGFQETVSDAWAASTPHYEPCQILFHKLRTTAVRLRKWSQSFSSNARLHLHMALQIILRLDIAQESRSLSPEEFDLRKRLKRRVISLAVLERARKRQCAHIRNLKEGDANTKFFHLKINGRRRKNFIHKLSNGAGWVTKHEDKENIMYQHFTTALSKGPRRTTDFNWQLLHFTDCDLSSLGDEMTDEEVIAAIKAMPSDKAPGPDGFTGAFFKSCWPIIKDDLMKVISAYSSLHADNFHWLNSANVVLLPKKEGAEAITDFRPISLIHAVAKIVAKVMAMRLTPFMNILVSRAQSAFIKSRCIHDNFMYVRNYARRLQRTNTPSLLLKLNQEGF